MEALINTIGKNVVVWTRRTLVQIQDNRPEIKELSETTTLWLNRTRVILGDNLTAMGQAIQSRLGN